MAKLKQIINCAIIGYGPTCEMGKMHGESLQANPDVKMTAVCDLNPKLLEKAEADFPGICTYTSVTKMLDQTDCDLAIIITPHNTHAKLAVQCLEAGLHVIVEKPMCLSTKEATMMVQAAQKSQVMLSVFHNRRWDCDYLTLKKILATKMIGEIFHIEAFLGGYWPPSDTWRANKAISGGTLWDWGAHFTDWILGLMGPNEKVKDVAGYFHKRMWKEFTNEDQVEEIIRFESGAVANLQISDVAHVDKPKWRILGTEGGILLKTFDENEPIKVYSKVNGLQAETLFSQLPSDWHAYHRNVINHIRKGEALAVTPESVCRVVAVMEAAEKSAKSGRPEKPAFA